MESIVVAYGSLMSAHGLSQHGGIRPTSTQRVGLHNARRGFGKASIHGDRFAMVLEPIDANAPMLATPLRAGEVGAAPQGLALRVGADDLLSIGRREGYSTDALNALVALAGAAGLDLAAYLRTLLDGAGGDLVAYRRRLRSLVDYTSPHYIPHPIACGGDDAVVFLAAGAEGSGCDGVVPVRVSSGCCELMRVAEVWRRKPTESQLDYIAMCLLGVASGVRVDDLLDEVSDDLRARLYGNLADRPDDLAALRRLFGR